MGTCIRYNREYKGTRLGYGDVFERTAKTLVDGRLWAVANQTLSRNSQGCEVLQIPFLA